MPAPENQHDNDIARVTQRAKDIEDKLPKLKQWMEQGKVLLELVKDYWAGRYREVPYWAISAGALALLYVLNPADVIPDMIFGVGYLDDATVVAFCLKLIERELTRYKEWQATQKSGGKPGKIIEVESRPSKP
ncbi:MAG TPA: YkvA family protein [Prosthecobacter sp.]